MKAIVCTKYGTPDVLQLKEVEKPTPKDKEVLIRVHAAVVSPADCAFRKGEPFIIKCYKHQWSAAKKQSLRLRA